MDTKKLREIDPEFAEKLKKAIDTGEPVTVTIDKRVVRLTVKPTGESKELWADYDPKRVRKALDDVAGLFSDEKVDSMIDYVIDARRAGSRPPDRP